MVVRGPSFSLEKQADGGRSEGPVFMLDPYFIKNWKSFFLQTLFATLSILAIGFYLRLNDMILVASLGSTVVVIFSMPTARVATARNVIGGHFIGIISGGGLAHLGDTFTMIPDVVCYGVAVGVAFFLMTILQADHPPAAGTALGVAVNGVTWELMGALLLGAAMLSMIRYLMRKHIRDLRIRRDDFRAVEDQ
ncbi:MAG: HPP family protein [Verrucomicrobiota bacterium]